MFWNQTEICLISKDKIRVSNPCCVDFIQQKQRCVSCDAFGLTKSRAFETLLWFVDTWCPFLLWYTRKPSDMILPAPPDCTSRNSFRFRVALHSENSLFVSFLRLIRKKNFYFFIKGENNVVVNNIVIIIIDYDTWKETRIEFSECSCNWIVFRIVPVFLEPNKYRFIP